MSFSSGAGKWVREMGESVVPTIVLPKKMENSSNYALDLCEMRPQYSEHLQLKSTWLLIYNMNTLG